MFELVDYISDFNILPMDLLYMLEGVITIDKEYNDSDECLSKSVVEGEVLFGGHECLMNAVYETDDDVLTEIRLCPKVPKDLLPNYNGPHYGEHYDKYQDSKIMAEFEYAKMVVMSVYGDDFYIENDGLLYVWNFDTFTIKVYPRDKRNFSYIYSDIIVFSFKKNENPNADYERASEQRDYEILYEPTYNEEDGSM